MSQLHPIVAITGSSGAGTTTVRQAFQDIFRRQNIRAATVEGNAFLRYERDEMNRFIAKSQSEGRQYSHFGPETNLFNRLETLFKEYGEQGAGMTRFYVNEENHHALGQAPGTFTPWAPLPANSDLLFYEGLHGGVVARDWTRRKMSPSNNPWVVERRQANGDGGVDVAQYVDLLVGVVPVVNLEWIQKIHRDTRVKGFTPEAVTDSILRRMRDYVHFVAPQFSITDINFQRVPVVDTSNPFMARDIPTPDESIVVIRFREPRKFNFPNLLKRLPGSFMSRPNSMVIPGGKMQMAMEIICTPLIQALVEGNGGRRGTQSSVS